MITPALGKKNKLANNVTVLRGQRRAANDTTRGAWMRLSGSWQTVP